MIVLRSRGPERAPLRMTLRAEGFVVRNYASEPLIWLNTLFTAVATLLTPVMHTSAIKATSNAYSTRSWPSSLFLRP